MNNKEIPDMFGKISKAFSLSHCDYPTMLYHSAAMLRSLSLNVDPRHVDKIPIIFPILNTIFAACYLYVYLFSMIWFVFGKCIESGDVLLALIVFSLGVASEIGPCKLVFMFIYRKELSQLVAKCLATDAMVEPRTRLSANLMKTLRFVKRRAIIFWSIIMGNGFVYLMKPILLPGRHIMEDLFVFYGLEPMFESPNFEIAFTLNAMAVMLTVYLPSNTTVFQIISSGYIEAQMLAWSEELVNLWDDANIHYWEIRDITLIEPQVYEDRNRIVNEFVKQRLKVIINAHTSNIILHKMMERAFRGAIAVEFGILIVCLVAELLGGLENTYLELPFALVQVGLDCFIGQKLIDAGLIFERAVYNCKWENFDRDNMKLVMMMMIISNKTMTLTAGNIIKLDFVSFLGIINRIYSTYTTLRATMH